MNCPCGSRKIFKECCEPFHEGRSLPQSPEALMRSRFSAFFLKKADYLLATLHPENHAQNEKQLIEFSMQNTKWLSLRILKTKLKLPCDGWVEFVAFSEGNPVEQLHENSHFKFQNGRWYYTTGVQLPPIKLQRNDDCWCGSGKKLKKCHS